MRKKISFYYFLVFITYTMHNLEWKIFTKLRKITSFYYKCFVEIQRFVTFFIHAVPSQHKNNRNEFRIADLSTIISILLLSNSYKTKYKKNNMYNRSRSVGTITWRPWHFTSTYYVQKESSRWQLVFVCSTYLNTIARMINWSGVWRAGWCDNAWSRKWNKSK